MKNFMSALAQVLGLSPKKVKNGVNKPNGQIPHEVVEEDDAQDFECTQEMLTEKFQRAMAAADAHTRASENLTDVTSAGTLNVADVLAAKKKAGLG